MRFTILFAVVVLSIGFMHAVQAQDHGYGGTEFRLGPDDVIEVSIYQDKELNTTVPVRPDGKISLHLGGAR